jgi:hypothetical protein
MRIRMVGGVSDGKVWEGETPSDVFDVVRGYGLTASVKVSELTLPSVSVALVYNHYRLHKFAPGDGGEGLFVYGEVSLTPRQVFEELIGSYFPLNMRIS